MVSGDEVIGSVTDTIRSDSKLGHAVSGTLTYLNVISTFLSRKLYGEYVVTAWIESDRHITRHCIIFDTIQVALQFDTMLNVHNGGYCLWNKTLRLFEMRNLISARLLRKHLDQVFVSLQV